MHEVQRGPSVAHFLDASDHDHDHDHDENKHCEGLKRVPSREPELAQVIRARRCSAVRMAEELAHQDSPASWAAIVDDVIQDDPVEVPDGAAKTTKSKDKETPKRNLRRGSQI